MKWGVAAVAVGLVLAGCGGEDPEPEGATDTQVCADLEGLVNDLLIETDGGAPTAPQYRDFLEQIENLQSEASVAGESVLGGVDRRTEEAMRVRSNADSEDIDIVEANAEWRQGIELAGRKCAERDAPIELPFN